MAQTSTPTPIPPQPIPPTPPQPVPPTPPPTPVTACDPKSKTIRNGSTGEKVTELQRHLTQLGFGGLLGPPGIDGKFGPRTETAVKAFQRNNALQVDGIVGPITWGAICKQVTTSPSQTSSLPSGQPTTTTPKQPTTTTPKQPTTTTPKQPTTTTPKQPTTTTPKQPTTTTPKQPTTTTPKQPTTTTPKQPTTICSS